MNADTLKANWPLIIGGILVVLAFVAYSHAGSNTTSGYAVVPGTDYSAERAAAISANAQLAQSHEANILGAFGKLTDYQAHLDELNTHYAETIANDALAQHVNDNASVIENRKIDLSAYQTQWAGTVQLNAQNTQLAAIQTQAHVQQQQNLWSGIFSTIAAVFGG